MKHFIRAVLALVIEPRQDVLSLGRLSQTAYTGTVLYVFVTRPTEFLAMGAPAAGFLIAVFFILAAYNWGKKGPVQSLLMCLAGKWGASANPYAESASEEGAA